MLLPWFRKKKAEDTPDTVEETDAWLDEDDEEEDDEQEEREAIQQRVYAWGYEWSKTPLFEALTQEQKDESEFILESFTEFMYSYHDATPEQWNAGDMEDCCLDTLQRKITAEETYFRALAPVLASFFTYLGKTGRQPHGSTMARRVLALDSRIVAASKDPRSWGMAKTLAMTAMAEGVDLTDKKESDAFIARYNAQLMGRDLAPEVSVFPELSPPAFDPEPVTYARVGPKIGRNATCPCGSGKKYKKCCGRV